VTIAGVGLGASSQIIPSEDPGLLYHEASSVLEKKKREA
jgi:hypothetical protein